MRQQIIDYCEQTIQCLSLVDSRYYAAVFCNRKMDFHRQFQNGEIFSTRFGADFFTEVLQFMQGTAMLQPLPGQKLGEYDQNFNKWLKQVR